MALAHIPAFRRSRDSRLCIAPGSLISSGRATQTQGDSLVCGTTTRMAADSCGENMAEMTAEVAVAGNPNSVIRFAWEDASENLAREAGLSDAAAGKAAVVADTGG